MPQQHLHNLFMKNSRAGDLLAQFLPELDSRVSIVDANGKTLLGNPQAQKGIKYPIDYENQTIGWVYGEVHQAYIARLIEVMVSQEAEKKSLAAEVLNRYRELNMFYHLAENLAISINVEKILTVALQESCRLVKSSGGIIYLINGSAGSIRIAARHGVLLNLEPDQKIIADLIEQILEKDAGDIVTKLPNDPAYQEAGENPINSMLYAPLQTEQHTLGMIALVGERSQQFTAGDLKLLRTVASQAAQFTEIARLTQAEIENARIEHELEMARQVQIDLLPKNLPVIPGWSFAVRWLPAFEVAGDFYDIILRDDHDFDVAIGDVSEKGMHAALFMTLTRTIMRTALLAGRSPEDALNHTNRYLALESSRSMFTTLFLARIQPSTGKTLYANAGHNPPVYYEKQREKIHYLRRTGMALGILGDTPYQQCKLQLERGDFMLLYTDGVTEAFDPAGNQFGIHRLERILLEQRHASAEEIVAALEGALISFIAPAHPADDIAIFMVKRNG